MTLQKRVTDLEKQVAQQQAEINEFRLLMASKTPKSIFNDEARARKFAEVQDRIHKLYAKTFELLTDFSDAYCPEFANVVVLPKFGVWENNENEK